MSSSQKQSHGRSSKQYSSHFYRQSLNSWTPVTSRKGFLDELLVEKRSPSHEKKRPVAGPIFTTEINNFKRLQPVKELKSLNKETEKKLKLLEGLDLFSSREIKLWKSESWRMREKDLKNNYSKLSPIEEGRTEQSLPYH